MSDAKDHSHDAKVAEKTAEAEATVQHPSTAMKSEGIKEAARIAVHSLPYIIPDAIILGLHLIGDRKRAKEFQALKESLVQGKSVDEVSSGAFRKVVEHLKKGEYDQAKDVGIKAGFLGLGEADEAEMLWVTTELVGSFLDETPPDIQTPTDFVNFMNERSNDELTHFRLALAKIPERKDQVKALRRLARFIAAQPDEQQKKEVLQKFLKTMGVAHEPSLIGEAIDRGAEAGQQAAADRVASERAKIRARLQGYVQQPATTTNTLVPRN